MLQKTIRSHREKKPVWEQLATDQSIRGKFFADRFDTLFPPVDFNRVCWCQLRWLFRGYRCVIEDLWCLEQLIVCPRWQNIFFEFSIFTFCSRKNEPLFLIASKRILINYNIFKFEIIIVMSLQSLLLLNWVIK